MQSTGDPCLSVLLHGLDILKSGAWLQFEAHLARMRREGHLVHTAEITICVLINGVARVGP